MADTGQFMNESFAQLRDAEREFTSYISRSTRRSGIAMVAVCSLLVISVIAVGFMFRENRNLLTAVQQNGALVVQVPSQTPASGIGQNFVVNRGPAGQPEESEQEGEAPPSSLLNSADQTLYPVETEMPRLFPINGLQEKK
jgi:type VI protein secretion system component VasK